MTSREESLVELKIGQEAPLFKAMMHPDSEFALLDWRGKKNLVLAFYPKDNTPGCTAEMCAFSQELESFKENDTEVFGISCDSLESHQRFSSKHELKQALISDPQGEVGRLYGALREGRQSPMRKLFIIDKQGVIRHVHDGMPANKDLLEIIRSL